MKRVLCIILLLQYSCLIYALDKSGASDKSGYFLALSDIHFNPFYACDKKASLCPLIQKLNKQPVSQWKGILEKYDISPPCYGENTGYQLFSMTIKQLRKIRETKSISFVLLGGDLLAHNYKEQYQQYTHDYSPSGTEKFVKKSMLFIVQNLNEAFPKTDIFPTIGNNDAYASHYSYEPKFITDIANIWSPLIKSKVNKKAFLQVFPLAGYYQVDLMNDKMKMIVVNSTLFSPNTDAPHAVSQSAMQWLEERLKILKVHHQTAFLVMHIPAGIDVYETIKFGYVVPLWRDESLVQLDHVLKTHPGTVKALFAGHLHADWLQYLAIGDHDVPAIGIPGISPQFRNNPAFKIYEYDRKNFEIKDYELIYNDLNDNSQWKSAYNFQALYNSTCTACSLVDGIRNIKPSGNLADAYQFYYAILRDAQPITSQEKWHPHYWCAISNNLPASYQECLNGAAAPA